MFNLDKHPYFTKYTDPDSGIESYILTEKIAGMQQHFYFSECSVTKDGKYLWIRCTNPPSWFPTLAVISLDPENPFYRHFPNAGIFGGNPSITPEQDGVYFPNCDCIYKVDLEGNVKKIFQLDPEFVRNRPVSRMTTHSSVSNDGKYMILDMSVGEIDYVAKMELETGKFKILNSFGRRYNHAQFSPTRSDLFLIDQDWWRDTRSGEYISINNRIWLMNTDATMFEPLVPNAFYGRDGSELCHDFWSDDGYLCWVDYNMGTYECNVDTREITHVWKRPTCHCHTTGDRLLWVADQTPYEWKNKPCEVLFYDRKTNREINIFSALPEPPVFRGRYHVDPHPQFTKDGSAVICTTTHLTDTATVAITPVEPMLGKCRVQGREITKMPEHPGTPSWLIDMGF